MDGVQTEQDVVMLTDNMSIMGAYGRYGTVDV
jgi:hypothetical protein